MENIKIDLTNSHTDTKKKIEIYEIFNNVSKKIDILRKPKIHNAEIAKIHDCLNKSMESYESLSFISDYRTPRALKAYSKIFIFIFPLLFAPYFAYLNLQLNNLGFMVSTIYSTVLFMLVDIADNVENPFDFEGLDYIDFERENRFI